MPSDPRALLPLKPADLVLLLALSEEERHGYALAREIADRTDGLIALEPGNLYRIIRRLEEEGLVAPSARRAAGDGDDERRRYYRLTTLGGQVAALEVQRLRSLVASKAARALPAVGATA
ncbi:MAG: PadR family transcriptional regulator [Gemmatimonadaceae bacterium]